jgi:hypothetical protein
MNTTVHNNQNSVLSASTASVASVAINGGGSGCLRGVHNTAVGYAAPYGSTTINNNNFTTSAPDVTFPGSVKFDGDIVWKGRNLGQLIESVEDRLAILAEPNPGKLEKYAALKKAYDQYKLMERLIGEDD